MIPRLKTSKKSTPFPAELALQIKNAFLESFKEPLQNMDFIVEGRIYPQEILLRVGFLEKGQLKQLNFEVSSTYDFKKDNAVSSIHICVDFLGSILHQYFEQISRAQDSEDDSEMDLPYLWKEVTFEKSSLFFQISTVNTKLEEEANKLLGEDAEVLVKDEEDEDFKAEDLEDEEQEVTDEDDPTKKIIH
ncbi:MAG: hypothetical protein ACK5WZ_14020 [Pseudobdellovibrionaceae bacterium]